MSFNTKRAFITGIGGQDGSYLAELLLQKGYEVYGLFRKPSPWLHWLAGHPQVHLLQGDLLDPSSYLEDLIRTIRPNEIYNFAAISHRETASQKPEKTAEINGVAPSRLLEIIKTHAPSTRFFQASSAEIFGSAQEFPQTEDTVMQPNSPYATAKVLAHSSVVHYRKQHHLFACNGILYNHESPRRPPEFVSRKITSFVAQIHHNLPGMLVLGNLDTKRDWSSAQDIVEGAWLMLQQDQPDDYLLASGQAYSVREFVEIAFQTIGIELRWQGTGVDEIGIDSQSHTPYVKISHELFRPLDILNRLGNPTKAKQKLGWTSKTGFSQLVSLMVEKDIERISNRPKERL